jgi:hypothetical protein
MTQKQPEDYLWGAANMLRGMIDAADFKQHIWFFADTMRWSNSTGQY